MWVGVVLGLTALSLCLSVGPDCGWVDLVGGVEVCVWVGEGVY